jgi:hypothetical protein
MVRVLEGDVARQSLSCRNAPEYSKDPGTVMRILMSASRGAQKLRPCSGFPVTSSIPTLPPKEHAAYVLRDIFQYSQTEAARLLKEKPADLDVLLAQVRTRIGCSGSANHLQFTHFDSDVLDRGIHDPPSEDAPRRESQLDRSQL